MPSSVTSSLRKINLKVFKPTTPSLRYRVILIKPQKEKFPLKQSVFPKKQKSGRSHGKISTRHRGGGHKKRFRHLLFNDRRSFFKVLSIEYDPNRSGLIAKVTFSDNSLGYVIASSSLSVDDICINLSEKNLTDVVFKENTLLRLAQVPLGSSIYSLESKAFQNVQYTRSAGTLSRILFKTNSHVQVSIPSGERKWFLNNCRAVLGSVSQPDWNKKVLGKAGCSRWLSKRPRVRGVAMNPIDHPHGGGTGKRSGGRPSVTPWGRLTKCNYPTSKKRKSFR